MFVRLLSRSLVLLFVAARQQVAPSTHTYSSGTHKKLRCCEFFEFISYENTKPVQRRKPEEDLNIIQRSTPTMTRFRFRASATSNFLGCLSSISRLVNCLRSNYNQSHFKSDHQFRTNPLSTGFFLPFWELRTMAAAAHRRPHFGTISVAAFAVSVFALPARVDPDPFVHFLLSCNEKR